MSNETKPELTGTAKRIYDHIIEFARNHRRTPSMRELAADLDLNMTTIHRNMDRMTTDGWIERLHGTHVYLLSGTDFCPCCGQEIRKDEHD